MSNAQGNWITWEELTTVEDLHKALSMPLSKLHKPELYPVEEDALQFYKRYIAYLSGNSLNETGGLDQYYDFENMTEYDIMEGEIGRGGDRVRAHFAKVGTELADGIVRLRDTEITAISPDFAHIMTWQNFKGTAQDGSPFDLTYRCTQLMRRTEKGWRWYHDHFSFSADLQTGRARITG
ncbi:hypothetical protein MPH_13255 [Macrophomina phaseolina MS6]|uniref:SnoaL-like domain-containing protein n=1 Tax=Macrophomina phaseolina (strain MS6) TaxID=1126212 RepID=K2R679_MACPH|nr:hypothetical protein MPH_13255 [Macrophomina phaseolina MS6]